VNGHLSVAGEHVHRGELRIDSARNAPVQAEDSNPLAIPVIDLTRFAMSTRDFCVHVLAPAGEHAALSTCSVR
jgi:hypothetical protein